MILFTLFILDGSAAGLAARIARLEALVAQGVPVRPAEQREAIPQAEEAPPPPDDADEPVPAAPEPPPGEAAPAAAPECRGASAPAAASDWPKLVAALRDSVGMPEMKAQCLTSASSQMMRGPPR